MKDARVDKLQSTLGNFEPRGRRFESYRAGFSQMLHKVFEIISVCLLG